jgi:hypothetical protein
MPGDAGRREKFKVSTDEVPGFMGTIRPQVAGIYGGVKIDICSRRWACRATTRRSAA